MSSSAVSGIVFVVLICGALLGALIRNLVHSSALDENSQDVIKLGTGLLGTLAALVLGLLIASAKSSYDTQLAQVRKLAGDVVLLDFLLAQYGPDAHAVRGHLRRAIGDATEKIWRENSAAAAARGPFMPTAAAEEAFNAGDVTTAATVSSTFSLRLTDAAPWVELSLPSPTAFVGS